MYMQLNDAEAAFRTLKHDLSIRPVFHQVESRVNAHVLVCFLAYALYRTLDGLAKAKGLAMTPARCSLPSPPSRAATSSSHSSMAESCAYGASVALTRYRQNS